MVLKKVITLMLTFLLCFSVVSVVFGDATEQVTVDNEQRLVTVTGESIQVSGTAVTIAVWYPGQSTDNLTKDNIKEACAYQGETQVTAAGSYSFSFKLKENDPSGVYQLNLFIPGFDEPKTVSFSYRNVVRARDVIDIAQTGNAAAILAALNTGLIDVDIPASELYNAYGSADRGYIASYVEKNRPVSDTDDEVEFASLAQRIKDVDTQLKKTRELTKLSRKEILQAITENPSIYLLTQEQMDAFEALSETKQEQAIAAFKGKIADAKYPESISEAFSEALLSAGAQDTPSTPSKPSSSGSGSRGSGGDRGGSVYLNKDLQGSTDSTKQTAKDSFGDLNDAPWAKNAINILAAKEMVNGKEENMFCPNDNIKREELMHLLAKVFNIRAASASALPFKDCEYGTWYYKSVEAAYTLGIVKGVSSTEFGIGLDVTRQDLVVMVYNVLNQVGVALEEIKEPIEFADNGQIAKYATKAVAALTSAGVVNGQSETAFAPTATATRAEAAKIIYEVMYRLNLL